MGERSDHIGSLKLHVIVISFLPAALISLTNIPSSYDDLIVYGTNVNATKVYEDSNSRYQITYPSSWELIEDTERGISIVSPLKNVSDTFQEKVAIEVSNEGNLELNQLVGLEVIKYRQELEDFRLISSNRYVVSDNPWYIIIYTYTQGGLPLKVMQLWTILAGNLYSLTYTAEGASYSEYLTPIQEILDSFKIELETLPTLPSTNFPQLETEGDPFAITINPFTDRLYVTDLRLHTVSVYELSTDTLITKVQVGNFPTDIDVNTISDTIYVTNSHSDTVSVINGITNDVVGTIAVGSEPVSIVIDDTEMDISGLGFVSNFRSNNVSVIDLNRNTVISNITVGLEPNDLAVNTITNRLYVSNSGSDTISVIDYYVSETGTLETSEIATIKVGDSPTSLSLDEDSNILYVTNSESNTISVIDGSTNKVTREIEIPPNPSDILVNPLLKRLYVASYGM
ncbi:MAG TPA: beta-propeller fold lactonase family protein, partial [Nitrososphaeraceae archaeon]|nr:beta-propeller fold lactonase family protein [Nitrososphaeraceae archaeon]